MAQIDWEAFHEGLGLVNQAIGPWRALARLEEVLQYGTMLREQVLLAETQLKDRQSEAEEKKRELIQTDKAVAALKVELKTLQEQEATEKERLEKVWAELNAKHQTLYEMEAEKVRQEISQLHTKWKEEKARLQKEEEDKRALIQELTQTMSQLKDRIRGLG